MPIEVVTLKGRQRYREERGDKFVFVIVQIDAEVRSPEAKDLFSELNLETHQWVADDDATKAANRALEVLASEFGKRRDAKDLTQHIAYDWSRRGADVIPRECYCEELPRAAAMRNLGLAGPATLNELAVQLINAEPKLARDVLNVLFDVVVRYVDEVGGRRERTEPLKKFAALVREFTDMLTFLKTDVKAATKILVGPLDRDTMLAAVLHSDDELTIRLINRALHKYRGDHRHIVPISCDDDSTEFSGDGGGDALAGLVAASLYNKESGKNLSPRPYSSLLVRYPDQIASLQNMLLDGLKKGEPRFAILSGIDNVSADALKHVRKLLPNVICILLSRHEQLGKLGIAADLAVSNEELLPLARAIELYHQLNADIDDEAQKTSSRYYPPERPSAGPVLFPNLA